MLQALHQREGLRRHRSVCKRERLPRGTRQGPCRGLKDQLIVDVRTVRVRKLSAASAACTRTMASFMISGSAALNRHVLRDALGARAHGVVLREDVAQQPAPPHDGAHCAGRPRLFDQRVEIAAYGCVALEDESGASCGSIRVEVR